MEERLGVIVNSTSGTTIEVVNNLLTKGNRFTINVEDTGSVYGGLFWDNATQTFKVHKDWISTASETDLSALMIRDAFNSVEIAMLQSNANDAVWKHIMTGTLFV